MKRIFSATARLLLLLSMVFFFSSAQSQWISGTGGVYTSGNVAIGTSNLGLARLTVIAANQNDGIWTAGTGNGNLAFLNNMTAGAWNGLTQPGDNMILWKGSTPDNANAGGLVLGTWTSLGSVGMRITYNGNVLIGKGTQTNGAYKLDVGGDARANKVVVNTTGADFVFEPTYDLAPLSKVATYIQQYRHLPGIATAEQMQKNGVDLGDNQTRLLQKVEELTLYLIQQDKALDAEKDRNEKLEQRVQALEKLIQKGKL